MENRIKECQLDLFADRNLHPHMLANQTATLAVLHGLCLISALRRIALAATIFADATCGTIRLKLFKIGAQVRISVRRIQILDGHRPFPTPTSFGTAWAALDSALF